MPIDPHPGPISARGGPSEALSALIGTRHRDVRIFLAGCAPSVAILDAAERETWREIAARLAACPADATVVAWTRTQASGAMRRLLIDEDRRAVAAKDAIGHVLAQEAQNALQALDASDNAQAIRVETLFARLPADIRQLLARRACGERLSAVATGLRGGEEAVASALIAARAGLGASGDEAPPTPEPRLMTLVEHCLDGTLSPEDHVCLDAELTRNLLLSAILARQMRVHLIIAAQLAQDGPAVVAALVRHAAASVRPRSDASTVVPGRAPRQRTPLAPPRSGLASLDDRPAGSSNAIAMIGIGVAAVLAAAGVLYLISGRSASHAGAATIATPSETASTTPPAPAVAPDPPSAHPQPPSVSPSPALPTERAPVTAAPPSNAAAPDAARTNSAVAAHDGSVVLDDFEGHFAMGGSADAKTPLTVTRVPAPAGRSGNAMRCAWPAQHGKWVEAWYAISRPVPQLTPTAVCTVRFMLWLEADAGVNYVGVRFLDANNEHFQWRCKIADPKVGGWREIVIPILYDGSAGHWSGDGKLDFPLRLNAFGADLDSNKKAASSFVIDDVTLDTAPPR